ncbi:MAG: DMT family transporter [Gammaproteobacteria bacterium]|nr:DMT family transporter [Gammaproteobacteria bacterium]
MSFNVPAKAVVIAIVIHSLWGGNTVAVKYGLQAFPPLCSAFLRFVLGAVFIACWCAVARVRLWPERGEWSQHAIICALFTVQIGAMNIGFGMTSGSMGSILISTNPLFASLFAHFLIAQDRMTAGRALGLSVAFTGTLLTLVGDGSGDMSEGTMQGNLIVLLSAGLLGLRLALGARAVRSIEPLRVAFWQMTLALPLFGLGSLIFEEIDPESIDWAPIIGILYQGVVVAGLGFTVAFMLMRRYSPGVMLSFNFVAPVSGVALSALLLAERPAASLFLGMLLVAVGLLIVTLQRPARQSSP